MIDAINGIGHAAVATDPEFRAALANAGFGMDPETGEIQQLAPYVGAFSARSAQIRANIDRYEAEWRADHPGEEPGPRVRQIWDRLAWAEARPDKAVPKDGAEVVAHWNEELRSLGYADPTGPVPLVSPRIGEIDRETAAELVLSRLGAKRRIELADDLTGRAVARCTPLLLRPDVPEHVRALTSYAVLAVETEILERLLRSSQQAEPARLHRSTLSQLSREQGRVADLFCGRGPLIVVEGAAGAGKTRTLAAVSRHLAMRGRRLLVVTPTLKAAEVAARETGVEGHSAAWLIRQHGWRWDADGRWTRQESDPAPEARLRRGDLLLIDEAGMVNQDTALALLTIADETGARVVFMGDRHQLPAVGRGGVLDHALAWAHPTAVVTMNQVRRFVDAEYAKLSLAMREGREADAVFDRLVERRQIVVHAFEAEQAERSSSPTPASRSRPPTRPSATSTATTSAPW